MGKCRCGNCLTPAPVHGCRDRVTTMTESQPSPSDRSAKQVAVIDVGATSIRMAIAEIDGTGAVRTLETLSQAVSLGKDAFTKGTIDKATIEDCVRVLKTYRTKLQEYQISDPDQIRVVATSAVSEANNRLAFLDRVYIATGFQIEPIEDAELNRVTYMGIQPYLKTEPSLASASTIVGPHSGDQVPQLVVAGAGAHGVPQAQSLAGEQTGE